MGDDDFSTNLVWKRSWFEGFADISGEIESAKRQIKHRYLIIFTNFPYTCFFCMFIVVSVLLARPRYKSSLAKAVALLVQLSEIVSVSSFVQLVRVRI